VGERGGAERLTRDRQILVDQHPRRRERPDLERAGRAGVVGESDVVQLEPHRPRPDVWCLVFGVWCLVFGV